MTVKSLDQKLAAIHRDPTGCKEFIIADAKDADMAFGMAAPGEICGSNEGECRFKTLAEYREQIRQVIRQGVVDIVLMSASTSEKLCLEERLFENSHITPAIRANDASDIFAFRGSDIPSEPAYPFRTAQLDHAQCGHLDCEPGERAAGADLGLYSVTFNNDRTIDLATLNAYNEFRAEAERKGFRHFLEVFHPNIQEAVTAETVPYFINDVIARTLAGVATAGRPIFLKIPYPGPEALEELVAYDPHLIVGILGGSSGTTRDAFQMIHDAHKHGARVALYGRKINNAENQLAFIEFLRHIVDGVISPEEAVRAYHSVLEKLSIRPHRPLDQDMQETAGVMSYGGETPTSGDSSNQPSHSQATSSPVDFAKMTSEERLAYHMDRLKNL
ncbi:hypothetical protein [Thalassoglobus polymorphus]|uniref:Fructose-bisphosphate aldolase n=1 Tax=Thalassoglobus polymorphus TaxID=2527994 RepID=A0A517QRK2_9PLAN|nr:hypothetical protein [Thalassoglobus polymorphus]QDT34264.1 fructose-bisphosphate aldolase [Thalassoglobus polymorphus]